MEDPKAPGHPIKLTEYKVWLNGSEMLMGAEMVRDLCLEACLWCFT